jgi:hypothetical protein
LCTLRIPNIPIKVKTPCGVFSYYKLFAVKFVKSVFMAVIPVKDPPPVEYPPPEEYPPPPVVVPLYHVILGVLVLDGGVTYQYGCEFAGG